MAENRAWVEDVGLGLGGSENGFCEDSGRKKERAKLKNATNIQTSRKRERGTEAVPIHLPNATISCKHPSHFFLLSLNFISPPSLHLPHSSVLTLVSRHNRTFFPPSFHSLRHRLLLPPSFSISSLFLILTFIMFIYSHLRIFLKFINAIHI